MKYILKIIKGNDYNTKHEIYDGECFEIRRSVKHSKSHKRVIYINDDEVSKLHAKLFMIRGELIIHDLSSTNGTFINSKKITKALLNNSDILKTGDTELKIIKEDNKNELTFLRKKRVYNKLTKSFKNFVKLSETDYKFNPNIEKLLFHTLDEETQKIMSEVSSIISKNNSTKEEHHKISDYFFQARIIEGKQKGSIFKFYNNKIILGRIGDLIIDDDLLSREHVEISLLAKGVFKVKDLNSQNKTYINNKEVKVSTLSEKDVLRVGNTYIKFKYIDI